MDIVEWVILGIMQGFLEWLPVSSSGQISIYLANIAGVDTVEAVKAAFFLHLGTAVAGALIVRNYLFSAIKSFIKGGSPGIELTIATVVSAPLGFAIIRFMVPAVTASPYFSAIVGLGLLVTATAVILPKEGRGRVGLREAIIAGLAQGVAALPGISRSGLTIAAQLWAGVRSDEAVRFSILMGVIATGAAGIYYGVSEGVASDLTATVGAVSAFVGGLASGWLMIKVSRHYSVLKTFVAVAILAEAVALLVPR